MDNDSAKTNLLDPPLVAQYMRIIPVVCHKACTLRMELMGCELNGKDTGAPMTSLIPDLSATHVPSRSLHLSLIVIVRSPSLKKSTDLCTSGNFINTDR